MSTIWTVGKWTRCRLAAGAAAAAFGLPTVAGAQTTTELQEQSISRLDDVIVTAQKREQRLLDVPMAITAFTAEDLERRGSASLRDLQYAVPGLSLIEQGPGQQRLQVRGISNTNGLPTVGQYLDEMPVSIDDQTQSLDLRLIDIKQVEVLRGPQGTLYGEGSMGGTIRFLTADPDLNNYGGSIEASAGSIKDGGAAGRVAAVVNVPIIADRVGARLVAGYEDTGGWIDNTIIGEQDVNGAQVLTLRGKVLANLTDNVEVSLMIQHQEQDQDHQNFGISRKSTARVAERNNPTYDLINAVLRWDLGGGTLVNSFGYQQARNDTLLDVSNTYVPLLPYFAPGANIDSVGLGSTSEIEVYTNETRLSSATGGAIEWTVGLYGRKLDRNGTSLSATAPDGMAVNLVSVNAVHASEAWAAFGELTWNVTEALKVTGGLRYFNEERTLVSTNRSFGGLDTAQNEGDFSSLNPRINISYEDSADGMVYLSAAKGFRSGGFNLAATGGPATYDPDELWTYELGTKRQWFNRRLTFEGAIYYTDWEDVQSSFVPPLTGIGYIVNGGEVAGWGADFAVSARPVSGLTLSATYGWNDLEYQGNTSEHLAGDPVDYAVNESWSGSIDFRHPMASEVDGVIRIDFQHAGKAAIINRASGVDVELGARNMLNVRLGVDFGRYEAALFANNLFDERTPVVPGPFGAIAQNIEMSPRTIGVRFKATF